MAPLRTRLRLTNRSLPVRRRLRSTDRSTFYILTDGRDSMRWFLLTLFLATDAFANQAVITTTDYTSGALSSLDLGTNTAANDHLVIHSDAVVRVYRDKVYVLNRLGQDNVIVLDRSDLATPLTQYSTGERLEPPRHRLCQRGESVYLALRTNAIAHRQSCHGRFAGDRSTCRTFADADGLPENVSTGSTRRPSVRGMSIGWTGRMGGCRPDSQRLQLST